uniref:hypothetical protein n=1 Tax=Candidatus Pelagibacter sp. HIMB1695 TaxID=3413364 RepID=UPI003F853348
ILSLELATNYIFDLEKIRGPFYIIYTSLIFFSLINLFYMRKLYFNFEDKFLIFFIPFICLFILPYKLNFEVIFAIFYILSLLILSLSLKQFDTTYKIKILTYIFYTIIIYSFLICIATLAIELPYFYRYSGIFDNSNAAGRFAGFFCGLSFLAIFHKKKFKKYFIIISSITLFILIISNSRSPLFALICAILFSSLKSLKQLSIFLILFFIFFFLTLKLYSFSEVFAYGIDSKIERGASGRFELWEIGLDYLKIYPTDFYEIFSIKQDPHNNYISLALEFGWFYALIFYLYLVIILSKTFFKKIKKINPEFKEYNNYVIYCVVWTLAYGIFETSTHITSLYVGLLFYWLIIVENDVKIKNVQKYR